MIVFILHEPLLFLVIMHMFIFFVYIYIGDNNRQGFNGNRNTRPDTTDFMHVPSEEPPQYNDIVKNKYKA